MLNTVTPLCAIINSRPLGKEVLHVNRELRSINKINDDIKSADQTFLGLYMADLLTRINELDDKVLKEKLIQEYFENQKYFSDKDLGGTRTRINAAIRIIKAEKVIYALEQINGQNPRALAEAVEKSKDTLIKINNGELSLPNL